jgi:uncharacterized protein YjaG (DUF416 family)
MIRRFEESTLHIRLSKFSHSELVLFSLSFAERMLPNYNFFVKAHSWGNVTILRKALDSAWHWLDNHKVNRSVLESIREKCFEQAPHTEMFSSVYVSPALDAANSVADVIGLVLLGDIEIAIEVASFGRDTVDMYVQELDNMLPNSSNHEQLILHHPMMQAELSSQIDAIVVIENGITINDAMLKWRAPSMSSINLN